MQNLGKNMDQWAVQQKTMILVSRNLCMPGRAIPVSSFIDTGGADECPRSLRMWEDSTFQ